MNLPNKLTMLRIIMIPVFVFLVLAKFIPGNMYIALGVFILASLTDLLDGKIARKCNLVTNFGKFMDPLADKLLVITALLCLLVVDGGSRIFGCAYQNVALLAIIIIVAREFIISGFRLVACDAGIVLAASMWGKVKTATTMVSICLMIVVDEIAAVFPDIKVISFVIFAIAVTLTVVSLVDYLVKNINVISDMSVGKKEKKKKAEVTETEAEESKPEESTEAPLN